MKENEYYSLKSKVCINVIDRSLFSKNTNLLSVMSSIDVESLLNRELFITNLSL